jgi:hypothetical protein
MRKLFASTSVVLVTVATSFWACGGGGGGGGGDDDGSDMQDAGVTTDSNSNNGIDANNGAPSGLGDSCTPGSGGSGQGDCPAGYTCLSVENATHPWCSKACTSGPGDTCATGYSGPGVASCFEQITFGSAAPMSFCGVTCAGDGVNGCTDATCDGTCPSGLACSGTLEDSSHNPIGSACE